MDPLIPIEVVPDDEAPDLGPELTDEEPWEVAERLFGRPAVRRSSRLTSGLVEDGLDEAPE